MKVSCQRIRSQTFSERPNHQSQDLQLLAKVLVHPKADTTITFGLHQSHGKYYTKGRGHKKFEFGSNVSILVTNSWCHYR